MLRAGVVNDRLGGHPRSGRAAAPGDLPGPGRAGQVAGITQQGQGEVSGSVRRGREPPGKSGPDRATGATRMRRLPCTSQLSSVLFTTEQWSTRSPGPARCLHPQSTGYETPYGI